MRLVIAEKTSVAMTIATVLGVKARKDGYFEGEDTIVSWCVGHLVEAAQPIDYDEKYKFWELCDLPIIPKHWIYKVSEKTKNQYAILKKLMDDSRVSEIVCATDSGREGELIFRLVYNKANCKKPFKRLWTSSLEESAIKYGFANLKNGTEYENLYQSALCREKADWIIGMNASRLFSLANNDKINVGRVQSPVLSIIVERDDKITSFTKEKYFNVCIENSEIKATSEKIDNEQLAKEIQKACENGEGVVLSVEKVEKTENPPKLYDLTTLQRESNRFFGFTAKQTLDTAQILYEKKIITYPRTDSNFITEDMESTVFVLFGAIKENTEIKINTSTSPNIKTVINNSKVSDHFAIIPTKGVIDTDLTALKEDEQKVLHLIISKFYAALSEKHIYETVTSKIQLGENIFTAKGKIIIQVGFKDIESEFKKRFFIKENVNEDTFLNIEKGSVLNNLKPTILERFTSPPKKFTEDTLLRAMETAGNNENDEEDVPKKGLGTPATRASIIEKLVSAEFVTRDKNNFVPTDKGKKTISVLPETLKSAKLTADWEMSLQKIEKGEMKSDIFMNDIENFINSIIAPILEKREAITNCPRCKKEKIFEDDKKYYCGNKDCSFLILKQSKYFSYKKIKLTREFVKELLENGKIFVKDIFSEKKNKNYSAMIILDDTEKYVNFKIEFTNSK